MGCLRRPPWPGNLLIAHPSWPLTLDSEANMERRGPGALRVLLLPRPVTLEALGWGPSQEPEPHSLTPQSLGLPQK